MPDPAYLVFDIESVADGPLVARCAIRARNSTARRPSRRYRAELMAAHDSDFIPYTFHLPISVAMAKVAGRFSAAGSGGARRAAIPPARHHRAFLARLGRYRRPTLVSFNGRTFDLPLLELAAFRFGLSIPGWFNLAAKSFEQYRNRFNLDAHIDLQELLTNFGSTRFTGGLNLAANLLGKPGKMDVQGHMVQDLYDDGKLTEINDYCRCDALDTYFVFLRSRVLLGELVLADEQKLIAARQGLAGEQGRRGPRISALSGALGRLAESLEALVRWASTGPLRPALAALRPTCRACFALCASSFVSGCFRYTGRSRAISSVGDRGRLAQLVRALARQARGHRFESCIAHSALLPSASRLAYNRSKL